MVDKTNQKEAEKESEKEFEKELTLDEIKKLPPEERIQKLKELDARRKKEETRLKKEKEEAERALKDSFSELKVQEDQKEEEEEVGRDAEDQQKKKKQDQNDLEDAVNKEKIKIKIEQEREYGSVEYLTSPKMYNNLDRWHQLADSGDLSDEYEDAIKELYEKVTNEYESVKQHLDQTNKGETLYQRNEEMLDKLIATRKMLKDIGYKTNWFRRG
ncbi:hypothetical protein HN587_07635 [Candidatus Woesearchaeota archaeon]|jgi:hypothetical protein|nr:hypothetical protein [Candidatus Woesearchaeota archaeon]